jgi:hypothetical protein
MAKFGLINYFAILFVLCATSTYGQKVKYKDLFGLLSSKQYEQAEPFIKRYLKDNTDNPNALLYMGIIFQEKALKNDVLRQTNLAILNMDSAIIFYDKAYATITEKEVKRNDEYYQIYNRRDLRTGEFGVKLSDIQFDLEKRKETLRERIDKVKMVKHYFSMADSLYRKSAKLFQTIQNTYASEKELYLRSTEGTLKDLALLSVRFDSCTKMFDNYKNSVSLLGKIGYNQSLTLNEIKDFKKDGISPADFYKDDIQGWDYKKFAAHAKEVIEKEIIPIRDHLVTYDMELNKLREKLDHDSVSVKNDLTKLIDQLLLNQLKKFDPSPLPMDIFSLKIADLDYRSSVLEHKPLRDSANVKMQLDLISKEVKSLKLLDSLATKLTNSDIENEMVNYDHFIANTFSNSIILKSYIKALKEFADREGRKKESELAFRKTSFNWLVNGLDSIPLVRGVTRSRFKPLAIVNNSYTIGLAYTDSLNVTGYFYNIPPSHIPQIKVILPVDKTNFKLARLPYVKALSFSDAGGQIFFSVIYSERKGKDTKYPVAIAKIYRSDGLAWNNSYSIAFIPKTLSFKPETGELTLIGDSAQSVIDKNGKLLK